MGKKNAKRNAPKKTLIIDKYAVFRTSAVLFVIAAAFFAILLFGYSKNNKETASKLLYETAHQKAERLYGALTAELSYLETLVETSVEEEIYRLFDADKYKGLSESVYEKNQDEMQQSLPEISVLEDGNIELSVKNHNNVFLCAKLSDAKLEEVVDSGSFEGKSSVILYEVHSGNVVINTAEKQGFYGNKIGFLLNHSFGSGFSAKKMFSDIDDKKSGYTEIKAGREKYSVCYVPVASGALYILMFVPKAAVHTAFPGTTVAVLCAVLLVVFALLAVLLAVMGTKKVNDDHKKREISFEVMSKALKKLSEDDCIGIYVYRKAKDELDIIKDINSAQREITVNNGFSYLVSKTGLGEADKRKLKNTINLSGPGKDMQINLLSKIEKESINIQMSFSILKQGPKTQKALLCVVKRNEAAAKDTVNTVDLLTNDGFNTTCVELFLERNMWHFLWNNEPVFEKAQFSKGMQNNYDEQLKNQIIPYIKASDREKVQTTLDRLSLLCAFRNGELERAVVFGISDNKEHFSQRRLDVRIYRDNYNDEIKANFYVRKIHGEDKDAE